MGVQGVKKYSNDMLLENEEKVAFILKNITYIYFKCPTINFDNISKLHQFNDSFRAS